MAIRDNIPQTGGEVTVIQDSVTKWLGMYLPSYDITVDNNLEFTAEHDGILYAQIGCTVNGGNTKNAKYSASISVNGVALVSDSYTCIGSGSYTKNISVKDIPIKKGDNISVKSSLLSYTGVWSQGGSTVSYQLVHG